MTNARDGAQQAPRAPGAPQQLPGGLWWLWIVLGLVLVAHMRERDQQDATARMEAEGRKEAPRQAPPRGEGGG